MCLRTRRGERLEDAVAKLEMRIADLEHGAQYQGDDISALKRTVWEQQEALSSLLRHLGIKEGYEKI
jgi:uncharacterized coiled-coil protein SlyX